jgi:hypothetical protein
VLHFVIHRFPVHFHRCRPEKKSGKLAFRCSRCYPIVELLRAKRRVIAEAGTRLMPHACADSRPRTPHQSCRPSRSELNRLFGTVPQREYSKRSQQSPRENNRLYPAYFRVTTARRGSDNLFALCLYMRNITVCRKHRQHPGMMNSCHPRLRDMTAGQLSRE